MQSHSTSKSKVRELLNMLEKRPDKELTVFCQCLYATNQGHVVEEIIRPNLMSGRSVATTELPVRHQVSSQGQRYQGEMQSRSMPHVGTRLEQEPQLQPSQLQPPQPDHGLLTS